VNNRIHTVVVTYNNRDLLEKCVASVYGSLEKAGVEGTVTVVDNDSRDGSESLIRSRFPSVGYIRNAENLGTAKAFNRGIVSDVESPYTLLMNDDVELFPDTIAAMIGTLEKHPRAGGIPAYPVNPDGRPQRIKLRIFGLTRLPRSGIQYAQFGGTTACLYRTEMFEKTGLFDEFYFFYNEDLDLSLRAKREGIRFVFDPGIKVIHHKNQGKKKGFLDVRPHYYAADYYFYRKNYGWLFASIYRIMACVHIACMKRKLDRQKNETGLTLLREGEKRLRHTIRDFRNMRTRSTA
jgi:GT2 family glycosyltransferase